MDANLDQRFIDCQKCQVPVMRGLEMIHAKVCNGSEIDSENCDHDVIECGECQDCGAHISDFMDEDYGKDR